MKSILFGAAALSALVAGQPADATIVELTVDGTVDFGLDTLGLFGTPGRNLRGLSYRMDFTYDIDGFADLDNSQQINGGTSFNRPSPIRRGDLTIDGTTVSAIDPFRASYATFRYPASSQLDFGTGGPNGINGANFSWSRADRGVVPFELDASTSRTFGAGDTVFSGFQRGNAQLTQFTYLQLRPISIEIAPAGAAVPEPASWALMIAGFGLAGAALRRTDRARLVRA